MSLFDELRRRFDDWDTEVSNTVCRIADKTGLPENVVGGAFVVGGLFVGAKAGIAIGVGQIAGAFSTISHGKKAADVAMRVTKRLTED